MDDGGSALKTRGLRVDAGEEDLVPAGQHLDGHKGQVFYPPILHVLLEPINEGGARQRPVVLVQLGAGQHGEGLPRLDQASEKGLPLHGFVVGRGEVSAVLVQTLPLRNIQQRRTGDIARPGLLCYIQHKPNGMRSQNWRLSGVEVDRPIQGQGRPRVTLPAPGLKKVKCVLAFELFLTNWSQVGQQFPQGNDLFLDGLNGGGRGPNGLIQLRIAGCRGHAVQPKAPSCEKLVKGLHQFCRPAAPGNEPAERPDGAEGPACLPDGLFLLCRLKVFFPRSEPHGAGPEGIGRGEGRARETGLCEKQRRSVGGEARISQGTDGGEYLAGKRLRDVHAGFPREGDGIPL